MQTTTTIQGKLREPAGKKANRRLREEGWLPAIIYGHKEEPVPVMLPAHDVELAIKHGAHILEVDLGDRTEQVLIREVQYDHLGLKMLHVDLTRVRLDEAVEVTVPIVLRGTPKGVSDGGVLEQVLGDLEIRCVVTQIPESIRVNVAELELGQALHVKDLQVPEGVEVLSDPDAVVCMVRALGEEVEEAEEAAEEAAGAEPEVIGRGKQEEEEAEEQQ